MKSGAPTLCVPATAASAQKGGALRLSGAPTLLLIVLLAAISAAQSPSEVRYEPVLDNDTVAVFDLALPPGARAPSLQNEYDVIWIGLNGATAAFVDSDRKENEVQFRPGDVRFFRSFATEAIVNRGAATFFGVLLEFRKHASSSGCMCGSEVERVVCGCAPAATLPAIWAVALRNVTLAGTTLRAGQSFAGAVPRGNVVLVAITPISLEDDAEGETRPAASIQLHPGQAIWIPAGMHRLKNMGAADARFVTVEF